MRSSAAKIKLTSVDDLFSSEKSRAEASMERVIELPLAEMHPFKNHPFKVLDDEKMLDTAESIREHGVLVPAMLRSLRKRSRPMLNIVRHGMKCGSC